MLVIECCQVVLGYLLIVSLLCRVLVFTGFPVRISFAIFLCCMHLVVYQLSCCLLAFQVMLSVDIGWLLWYSVFVRGALFCFV